MFLLLDIPFEYWIERVTFGLLCVMFRFSIKTFYGGVPGFASDCPCGVCRRRLITFLLYVGPLFKNHIWNDMGLVNLTQRRTTFSLFWLRFTYIFMPHNMIILYLRQLYVHVSNSALFLRRNMVLLFYTDVVWTFPILIVEFNILPFTYNDCRRVNWHR